MLNLTNNDAKYEFKDEHAKSLKNVEKKQSKRVALKLISIFAVSLLIAMFLPWTQNIRGRGVVNTLRPEQRPQNIHSVIDGRIEKWFVREGDYVERGDTILFISEIVDKYFDPLLLERTQSQIDAKSSAVEAYEDKIQALTQQIDALRRTGELKIKQAENKLKQAQFKVTSDSMDYEAVKINTDIAEQQYLRSIELEKDGLKSRTDVENRKRDFQRANADKIAIENRLLASQNEVLNAEMELISLAAQFQNSIAKAESDKFTTFSNLFDGTAMVTKMQNEYKNFLVRQGFHYITAPQNGYITKTVRTGIGENIKSGEILLTLVPSTYELAVEMFIRPIDLPLIKLNQKVRIQFDGWPAIIFSGWPGTSFGTFGGRVFAIDNFISDNGMYRIIVSQDYDDYPWPNALRAGAGANSILLLNDVPVWYELWRQFNGFPPDYYAGGSQRKDKQK